ncbi:glycoside hydrolase family 9 protein [Paenibacillus soyae]|uniref:Endoglucanase n=1 Tax=Paenibacillus soyae TaxID=2969249 RepID=A0A9X2MSP2_9BACL|nr:glycoside hydrolase family 9 protein [Paenibacillus soyae]MCR2805720.1 glycoside hydrolase family 9 protein [Paenibacillus soyae]
METIKRQGIAVNQLGYRGMDAKIAVIRGEGGNFRIVDASSGSKVWEGEAGPLEWDEASGETVSRGDFTSFRQSGTYRIESGSGESSYPFVIADSVYEEAHRAMLKAFYFFRCGMELEERCAGPWTHGPCHLTPAIVYGDEEKRVDAYGGWHDAGDYGKYVGPGAKAVADLLLAEELYPQAFARPLGIPESGGAMPDVLQECRYELEWMLRMQDGETGGAYHKLTTLRFPPGDTMPEDDTADLYVSPVSATATGCFAAVMAMAARRYRPYDEVFAASCLSAAERAWAWLEAHPDYPGFKNPPTIATGEYGDAQDADERYWAAAELYRTTGEARYHAAIEPLANAAETSGLYELGWANMSGYGTIAYLFAEREKAPELEARLKEGLLRKADELAAVCAKDGYGISLQPEQYIWGSNMLVMNHAMLLLLADRISGGTHYEQHALRHVHYLFGTNTVGMSYVTGYGAAPILFPHHRPSEGDGVEAPIPGLVSGGPNRGLQDDYAREHLAGKAPAASFADVMESYSTNEVAIYWNSPAVFALSRFV